MRRMNCFKWVVLLCIGWLVFTTQLYGQASLAGENIIDTIDIDGTLYTCVRDALKDDQWYYIPNSPRLVEHKVQGKMMPKFTLVRYQYKEGGRFIEGGVLQFEINMALPPNVVDKLKDAIAKRIDKKARDISLGALPFSSARLHVYSPIGELFTSATPTEGIAPNVATGSIPFSFKLEGAAAADIMSALVGKGQGGVPVAVDFDYAGITPPVAGLYADVDMKKLYSHFEKNEKTRTSFGCFFWRGSSTRDTTTIRETIKATGAITFSELQSDDERAQETMDQFRDWVLERISKDLLILETPPPKFDPANAQLSGGGWFGSTSHAVSVRDVKQDILVKRHYSAEVRRTVTRHSVGGSLIGIGNYPEDIREQLVFDVPEGNWDKVFYTMPTVTADPSVGIQTVKLEIGILSGKTEKKRDAAQYDPQFGDWKYGTDYVSMMSWGLKGLAAATNEQEGLKIHTKLTVVSKAPYATGPDTRIFESEIPAFDGKSFVAMPTDTMYAYMIFADSLSFNAIDPSSNLTAVSIAMTVVDASNQRKTARFLIRPTSRDPYVEPIGMLVPEDAKDVRANITFQRSGASSVRWSENNKNLLEMPEYGGWLFLDDSMWKED
jgi:hypothetical protein